jgi:hypothetical protein
MGTMSDFLDWLEEDAGDRRVQQRIESELQNAYDYQTRQQSAMRSHIEKVQGSLEQRLNRLTEAFYAFVELSDLRAELAVFEDEASVRHAALRLLRALRSRAGNPAATLPLPPADLPRCPGYWLRPAVVSVAAALSGDATTAAAALAEAQQLDPVRTAVFRVTTLAVAGRAPLAAPLLAAALQQPGDQVTYAQRALWRACAHGVYGEPGTALILQWLAGYAGGLDAAAATAEDGHWASQSATAFKAADGKYRLQRGLPGALTRNDELVKPLLAAAELGALSAWVREALTGEPAGLAGDPATGQPATAQPATQTPGAAVDPVAALAAVAAALTEEGSQEEVTLARRARELREIIDDRKATRRPSWDASEDATLAVLRADAFGTDLRLRKVAMEAGAAWVTALAGQLLTAASAPPPPDLTITVDGHDVTITAEGQSSLKTAYAEIEQENAPQGIGDRLFGKKHAEEEISRERGWLDSRAGEAAAAFAGRVTELHAAAQQAAADHETITAALPSR